MGNGGFGREQGAIEDARKLENSKRTYGVSSRAAEHIDNVKWIAKGRATGKATPAFTPANQAHCQISMLA
jgi:hypothetical protein